jgi:hypothetical protein
VYLLLILFPLQSADLRIRPRWREAGITDYFPHKIACRAISRANESRIG